MPGDARRQARKPARWFLVANAAACCLWGLQPWLSIDQTAIEILLLVVSVASSAYFLSQKLPPQNVLVILAASAALGFLANAAYAGEARRVYLQSPGSIALMGGGLWQTSLFWVACLLNSRGTAHWILRGARSKPDYGLRLLLLTVLLVIGMEMCLEIGQLLPGSERSRPFQAAGRLAGAAATALLIQALLTPWLIRKSPGTVPDSFGPGVLWVLLSTALAARSLFAPG